MLGSVRLFIEAILSVGIMATLAVISAFAAAAITGDRALVMAVGAVVFTLTGVVLAFRLWRMAKEPALPLNLDS